MDRAISDHRRAVFITALAPLLWGASWIGISEFMPPDRPLYAAVLRALPAGLVLLLLVRRLPSGSWWWRAMVLGTLNFGIFFALLTVAAYRVPGGVGATMGALQPLMVAALGIPLLAIIPTARQLAAGVVGIVGVAMLVFEPDARLDMLGVGAAICAVASMALGLLLTKRWADPAVTPLASTAWQLIAGSVLLVPAALVVEGAPPAPTGDTWIAIAFVGLLCTGVANWAWFEGLAGIPATTASFLTLLAPVVATAIGWVLLDETLTALQVAGAAIALGSVALANSSARRQPERSIPTIHPDAEPAPIIR